MAWADKPTDAQINALYSWVRWHIPTKKAQDAVKWLAENSDRRAVSYEMKRIRELYMSHKLNEEECFKSSVWDDCPIKDVDYSAEEK